MRSQGGVNMRKKWGGRGVNMRKVGGVNMREQLARITAL